MLLQVKNLQVTYKTSSGRMNAVSSVDLKLGRGQAFGIVGESGCGKSTLVKSLLRLLPNNASVSADSIAFNGRDLLRTDDRTFRQEVLWRELALVPQSAQNSLNPVYRVGEQVIEAIRAHSSLRYAKARERTAQLFDLAGLHPDLMNRYPHEFSGGMRQRAMIAMAFAFEPALVIMDEPTTGLDVLMQERVLSRILEIRKRVSSSILLITHDIALIAEFANRVGVMYAGRVVEEVSTPALFETPFHPYTLGLRNAFPSIKALGRDLISIPGSPPKQGENVDGCGFAARCPFAIEKCRASQPGLLAIDADHLSACFRHADIEAIRAAASERRTWHSSR